MPLSQEVATVSQKVILHISNTIVSINWGRKGRFYKPKYHEFHAVVLD
jgi:hypothetical protein